MCGIFGIFNHSEASNHTYLGLYALQHRGQESAGIVSSDGKQLYHEVLKPSGLAHSSISSIYRRIQVKAGTHTLKARLKDHAGEDFNYEREETVTLAPGRIMVIDFKAATGGFIFKNKNDI